MDFTRGIYSDGRMKAFLEEHGVCILPEEAIQHIKEMDVKEKKDEAEYTAG